MSNRKETTKLRESCAIINYMDLWVRYVPGTRMIWDVQSTVIFL